MEDDINSIVPFRSGAFAESQSEPAKAEPVEAKDEPKGEEAAPPAATERDEAGRFKAKDEAEKPAEAAKPEGQETEQKSAKQDKASGQLAALMAERAKRQELERELAQLRAGNQPSTAQPETDIFTDPEKAVQTLVEKQVAPLRQRFFNMSMQAAQGRYGDEFDAAAEHFMVLAEANPNLSQQLRAAEDPGEFVYLVGTSTPEFRQAQAKKATEALAAKEAENAALKAEIEALKKGQSARDAVPDSLNRQPSGSVPEREADQEDAMNIVRFKSG